MQATTDPKQATDQQQKNVVIFVDYPSVLIERQKTYPKWRFDSLLPSVKTSETYCCQVAIWLWKSALSYVCPEFERQGLARVHTLDDYVDDVDWCVTSDLTYILNILEDKPMYGADWDSGGNSDKANDDYVEVS
ncbi:hypothetical protein VTI28DRAFT_9020 [Corynascus sepedonium]